MKLLSNLFFAISRMLVILAILAGGTLLITSTVKSGNWTMALILTVITGVLFVGTATWLIRHTLDTDARESGPGQISSA